MEDQSKASGETVPTEVGRVLSYPQPPNTRVFFVSGPFQKFEFVKFEGGLGLVEEVEAHGFVYPFDAFYQEVEGLKDLSVEVCRIRVLSDPQGERVRRPPRPGGEVRRASEEDLKEVLPKKGIRLGKVYGTEVGLRLPVEHLLRRHLAILAMSGAGKSCLVKKILLELARESSTPIIVADHHGEYGVMERVLGEKVLFADSFVVDFKALPALLQTTVPDLTEVQRRIVEKAIASASSWKEALAEVEKQAGQFGGRTKESVLFKLQELEGMGLVGDRAELTWQGEGVPAPTPGQILVLQLHALSEKKAKMVLGLMAHHFFSRRKARTYRPFFLVVEEAHNYIGERGAPISKRVLETIAREGRKFGAGLAVVSQRPRYLSKTVLAQLNTYLVMRTVNPTDLAVIRESCEGLEEFAASALPQLRTRQGICFSEVLPFPVMFEVDELEEELASPLETLDLGQEDYSSLL